MVVIKGLEKLSMVDYPGEVACTVFLPGCNFRCGFCHNPDLINNIDSIPSISEREFFDFLESRKAWLTGVCITGGEPCLSEGLIDFVSKIKSKGFKVKLDTNGSIPRVLKELIDAKLIDFIAMDIKGSPERYSESAGVRVNITLIQESINLIRSSKIPYEFRTTIIPKLHSSSDLLKIGEWLEGSDAYCIQQFRADFGVLDPNFKTENAYTTDELKKITDSLRSYFKRVELRV